MSQASKPQAPARFTLGNAVRVRSGVTDPDFADIPLGGWAGKTTEVENSLYFIRWSQETLKNMHPVYRNRCERAKHLLQASCGQADVSF